MLLRAFVTLQSSRTIRIALVIAVVGAIAMMAMGARPSEVTSTGKWRM